MILSKNETNLPSRVLVVDHDLSDYNQLSGQLAKYPIASVWARDAVTALRLHQSQNFDLALIQKDGPETSGLSLAQKIREFDQREKGLTGLVLSTTRSLDSYETSLLQELGGVHVIAKPYSAVKVIPVFHKTETQRKQSFGLAQATSSAINGFKRNELTLKESEKKITPFMSSCKSRAVSALISFYLETKSFERGLAVVNSLLTKRPRDISLLNAKSKILLELGMNSEAIDLMETCDKIAPKNIKRLELMTKTYLENNKPSQSVLKMKELVDLYPENNEYKFKLFNLLFDHGFDDHCRQFCRESSHPQDVLKYYNNRGVTHVRAEEVGKAIESYETALKINPNYPGNYRIHYNIALAIFKLNDRSKRHEAIDHLNSCLKINPTFGKAQRLFNKIRSV